MTIDGRLKSIFVMPAIIASVLILVFSVVMALAGDDDWPAWAGAALAASTLPVIMGRLMTSPTARTSENLPLLLLLSMTGSSLAAWEVFFDGTAGILTIFCAGSATLIMCAYVFWYSRYGRYEDVRLGVGSKMPEFELNDLDGNAIRTIDLTGSPTVYLFYRGNWCPLCMAQIGELAERYQQLAELGITVCLISPQSETHTQALARQHEVPFLFLVDHQNKVANLLDIAVRNGVPAGVPGGYDGDTVMPTLIVTNGTGTIVFSDQTDNYRVRPEPDAFLAILRRARAMDT